MFAVCDGATMDLARRGVLEHVANDPIFAEYYIGSNADQILADLAEESRREIERLPAEHEDNIALAIGRAVMSAALSMLRFDAREKAASSTIQEDR